MDILIQKMSEYLKESDSQMAMEVVTEMAKQYNSLIDQSIHTIN